MKRHALKDYVSRLRNRVDVLREILFNLRRVLQMPRKFLVLFVVLALCAALISACGGGGGGSTTGGGVTIKTSDDLKFTPNRINAKPGQTVEITFDNTGGKTEHDFVSADLKANVKIPAGQLTKTSITAPAAGTYNFICSIPGHKEAGMVGTIEVR